MDGREELGDISATPPVAAAFSSSLMTIDQTRRSPSRKSDEAERRSSLSVSRFGPGERRRAATLEAGEASRTGKRGGGGGGNGRG
ncbi:hypothetical protein M440DRAFT_1402620 [Trichoderma longibrachiatum ATCC 18648]|uniref:Uncharacterized protein n=1 Tax=Trichoderma longibrachiatum ATCC 18648 TaxID=983965 RepID=A0A2T4C0F6_TRILO|nr:hypothetical protein M440DRAFT_1402620 [Trichoderma longibrachiatum ATCC 18648]